MTRQDNLCNVVRPWSSLEEGDEQVGSAQQLNMCGMMPCMCCIIFGGFNKQNSFLLGPLQPSSTTTKELHEYDFNVRLTFINEFLPPGPGRNGSESGGKRKNDEESETRRRGGNGRKTREGERKKRKLNGREWRPPGTNNIKLFPWTKLKLDFGTLTGSDSG